MILDGISSSARRFGTSIQLISSSNFSKNLSDSLPPVCIAMGIDKSFLHSVIFEMQKMGKHTLLAGCDSESFGLDISCVTPSRRIETKLLIDYLLSCGKSSLALVGFNENSFNDSIRYHAATATVAAHGFALLQDNIFFWKNDPEEAFLPFLKKYSSYDAVVCPNDFFAVYFINRCITNGISIPNDLFVASFGNSDIGKYHNPSLTSMASDYRSVGEQAYFGWRFLMNSEPLKRVNLRITSRSELIIRESTANMNNLGECFAPLPTEIDTDLFFENETILKSLKVDKCLSMCDKTNISLIEKLLDGKSLEKISYELFISSSTLRYRLKKLYESAGVNSRLEFEELMRQQLLGDNPFKKREPFL